MTDRKVLLDIMGTVCHAGFIRTMSDHFKEHGPAYVSELDDTSDIFNTIREKVGTEVPAEMVERVAAEVANRNFDPAFMQLMGLANLPGYAEGRLVVPFFDDVPNALRNWRQNGQGVFVYSQGSPQEQATIFRHTSQGDLTGRVTGYIGTGDVGKKTDPDSFKRIAERLGTDPSGIVFYSDLLNELDASYDAGVEPVLVVREGNKPVSGQARLGDRAIGQHGYRTIESFDGE